ncbi:MAG: hypothetical protein ACFFCW_49845 [Candidatus Hodarchaeota archaeon]
MKKMGLKLLVLVIIGFMSGCATLPRQAENLRFSRPNKEHKYAKTFTLKEGYLTRFVYEGKSIDDWTEALEAFNTLRKNYPPTLEGAYNFLIERRKKNCPESSFNVISKDSSSILYEIKTTNCPPHSDENSITRILYGNTNAFVLIYTNKIKSIPKEIRDEWIKIFSEAYITTGWS